MLIRGDYEGFVRGYADAEGMPEDLCRVEATGDSLYKDSTAYVMLQLHFSDSTSEQIGLSLVLQEDGWKMK